METNKVYVPVIIKTSTDLPKEKGWYAIQPKENHFQTIIFSPCDYDKNYWLKYVDWYLLPRDLPTDEEIKKSIPYPNPISKHQSDQNIGWIKALKWFRDKLLNNPLK